MSTFSPLVILIDSDKQDAAGLVQAIVDLCNRFNASQPTAVSPAPDTPVSSAPTFQVRLLQPMRIWTQPDFSAPKSAAPDPAGTLRTVYEMRDGWYRLESGWMPAEADYSVRVTP